jgi:hypothetical protein
VIVRGVSDFRGIGIEAGAELLGRYFLVEVAAVVGDSVGLGARAGGRLPFAHGLLSAQLTLDGVAFFRPDFSPGAGASLGLAVHALSFLDVLVEGSLRFMKAAPGYRDQYGLGSLALRLRWPTALDD